MPAIPAPMSTAMSRADAGMAAVAVNMHIPSAIIPAAEQVNIRTRRHHINAAAPIHIPDTSRDRHQRGGP